jgi:hypothetical protein
MSWRSTQPVAGVSPRRGACRSRNAHESTGPGAGDDRSHREGQPARVQPPSRATRVDDGADEIEDELHISSRRQLPAVDAAGDHRPPLVTALGHHGSDDRFDLGAISFLEQPRPCSTLGLPTDSKSPRKGLAEIALERSSVGQRALAHGRSHSVDRRRRERRPAGPPPIDRRLVDQGPSSDLVHSKAVVARPRELSDRGIEHAANDLLATAPQDPLGATRRPRGAAHDRDIAPLRRQPGVAMIPAPR